MMDIPARQIHNRELGEIFHRMAGCYRYLGPEQRFRAIAYETAARTVQGLKDDIALYAKNVKSLDKIHGIGESIGKKIMEYLKTGKVAQYEKLKQKVPEGLLELMDIMGFGPSTVKLLHKKLRITNKEELVTAIENDRLKKLKGFGPRKIENLKRGLKLYKTGQARMLLPEAMQAGNDLLKEIRKLKAVIRADLAGSLRRRKETIGDIDIIVAAGKKDWKMVADHFSRSGIAGKFLAKGPTKISFLLAYRPVQVDIRLVSENEYGAALMYFTGSKEHNVQLRTWARSRGWKLSEYGVFDARTGKRLAGRTEAEIFEWFDMQFIPPELREAAGEVELARAYRLPKIIELKDIRGDLQMHSRWSDGAESIEAIADYVIKNFPAYEYIVLTDHSPSERVARGLQPAEFKKQFREIDRINRKLGKTFIKKGVEVSILADGKLDLGDELLSRFDWVIASIHSGFNRDNTDRLLKACAHPYVHCIGHPAGRLIGKREPYAVNWDQLFKAAAANGTAIEINAQPDRLDLKDSLVRDAAREGVFITISTDAHMLSQFDFMEWGVAVARRGWCTSKNILNAHSWSVIEKFRKSKMKKVIWQPAAS